MKFTSSQTMAINELIKKAVAEEHKKAEKDLEFDKEFEIAEEAHRTAEGWCCACGYDMAILEDKIKKAVAEERAKWLKEKNKSETPEYINIKGIKKISCVKE